MKTPVMVTETAIILLAFIESWPNKALKNKVNNPEVDERIVVLATLVLANAALDKYCKNTLHS
jgi:hypothetical protein